MSADLGFYLHVPFCKHACPYCDFYKLELRDFPARVRLDFPEQLRLEAQLHVRARPELTGRNLATIYFGGGTPSTLVPAAVGELITSLQSMVRPQADPEVTLEANPENLTPARSAKWRAAGVNRLSIGVQSFQAEELRLLERLHAPEVIGEAVRNARAAGFTNLSLDLMFALPDQTMKRWQDNLQRAVELEPNHISFYGLTYHEGTNFERWLQAGRLEEAGEDLQAEMYLWGSDFLQKRGYEHYEISNFARPGFRSRHNQRYWSRADVLGLGPGAHSNIGTQRWANPENLECWSRSVLAGTLPRHVVEELPPEEALGERLFTRLRTAEGVNRTDDPELYDACVGWLASARAEQAAYMVVLEDSARLTRAGWLVSDTIIDQILVKLGR